MTPVRQEAAPARGASKTGANKVNRPAVAQTPGPPAKKAPQSGRGQRVTSPSSSVAQVRLQADELVELRDVMRQLGLTTVSEALREGIHLLAREAREITAAEEIRRFYGGEPAPLPAGVAPATEEELAAADSEKW